MPTFYSAFQHQPKFAQKQAQKRLLLAKHKLLKKHIATTPQIHPKLVSYMLSFLKDKALMLTKNTTSEKDKNKGTKRDLKDKTWQKTQKQKGLMKQIFEFIFWCCTFMKQ